MQLRIFLSCFAISMLTHHAMSFVLCNDSSELPIVKIANSNSYYFSRLLKNWADARTFCQNHNMQLLSIETEEENTVLSDYIKQHAGDSKLHIPNGSFWTSGTDVISEDKWIWTAVNSTFTFSPANSNYRRNDTTQNCLDIYFDGTYLYLLWADETCSLRQHFICEKTCE